MHFLSIKFSLHALVMNARLKWDEKKSLLNNIFLFSLFSCRNLNTKLEVLISLAHFAFNFAAIVQNRHVRARCFGRLPWLFISVLLLALDTHTSLPALLGTSLRSRGESRA